MPLEFVAEILTVTSSNGDSGESVKSGSVTVSVRDPLIVSV